jgi:hypothetical protein
MSVNYKLKARIVEMYRNASRFAICCGRNDNWISRIIQGQQLPTPAEKQQIQLKLRIPEKEIDSYFFGK